MCTAVGKVLQAGQLQSVQTAHWPATRSVDEGREVYIVHAAHLKQLTNMVPPATLYDWKVDVW